MSWYIIGRYPTGEEEWVTLKRWKHMPERWWGGKIRRIMWKSKMIQREDQLERQLQKDLKI